MASLYQVTAPTIEPLTVEELQAHLRVTADDDYAYISDLGKAAREWCEVYTRQTMITTTWRQVFDCWPTDGILELYRPPLASVTSVLYTDGDGNEQTLATDQYVVDTESMPGRVVRAYGVTLPVLRTQGVSAPVKVNYVAGKTAAAEVSESFKHAIKLLVGHWYDSRQSVMNIKTSDVEMTTKTLLSSIAHGAYP